MTNKEWLCTLSEEEVAEIIWDIPKKYTSRYVGNRVEIIAEWLKQEHTENWLWWKQFAKGALKNENLYRGRYKAEMQTGLHE